TQLARHQFDVLQSEIGERQASVEKLREEIEARSANVLRDENKIARLRGRFMELEHQISESQHGGLELKSQLDRHERRINFNQERFQEIQAQHGSALSDSSQSEERRGVAEQELSLLV